MDHMTDIPFAIFAFVLMISIIVTIHEYGHYQAARWFGLIGTHFSVGFGGKIARWTDKRGTEWRLSPILPGRQDRTSPRPNSSHSCPTPTPHSARPHTHPLP